MESRIAFIGIVVDDRDYSATVNTLLHEYGDYIIGRLGVPYRDKGLSLISIIIDAPGDLISALSGKLGRIAGVQVKTQYVKEK
ncbi:iron-only hydrogenase system regulator [Intestinibacillus massiliensis]|nr:iron-only hydrogenase system regulator [Intestinibacillus massiliensis]